MREYITDSIFFKKNNKDFLFSANEIYTWKIVDGEDGFLYKKTGNKELSNEITGVVSSSNYRLLFDILNIDKDAHLYLPEYNQKRFINKYKISKKDIDIEFDKYMKRSYISYLSYISLKNIGLKRIESFLILLSTVLFSEKKIYDNIFINNDLTVSKINIDKKQLHKKDIYVNLYLFIYSASIELNYEFVDVFSYILKLYSELKCSDPFKKEGFEFFEDDNELYIIYNEIKETDVYINRILLTSNKGEQIVINKGIDIYSDIINNYYLLQEEDYFEKKIISSSDYAPSIIDIIKYLNKIIPLKDILLSIQLLERMKKINIKDSRIEIKKNLKNRLNLGLNKDWISLELWERIYNNVDFVFNEIIEPIDIDKITFECPVCKNNVYSITPQKLFCSSKYCNFTFHRSNLASLGVEKISLENIVEGIKNKSILLEDKNGKNIPVFLKNNKDFYSFWIK